MAVRGKMSLTKETGRQGVLLEVLQVEVHQARVVILVSVSEEAEVALRLIEARGRGQCIYGQETAARAVVVPEHHADDFQDEFAEAHAGIAAVNSQTANLQSRIVLAPLEVLQVALGALERFQISLRSQLLIRVLGSHLKRIQFGELRLASSYASQHLRFSSSDNGVGCSICQRNRSASLPVSTGVSLIGLAIFLTFMGLRGQRYE